MQYERTDDLEGTYFDKSDKSKKCEICHYWSFRDKNFKFKEHVCDKCNSKIAAFGLENFAIINVKGVGYRIMMLNMTEEDVVNIQKILNQNLNTCPKNVALWKNWYEYSEETNFDKTDKSKECIICHYWLCKDKNFNFEKHVCNHYHDISIMCYKLENIATFNIKGVNYRCIFWNMTFDEAFNLLNNSKLDEFGSL